MIYDKDNSTFAVNNTIMKWKYLGLGVLSVFSSLLLVKPSFGWPPVPNTTYTVPQGCSLHLVRNNAIEPGNQVNQGRQVYVVSNQNNIVRVRYQGLTYTATQFCG